MLPIPTKDKVLAGTPVTSAQLDFLIPGVTTEQEVVRQLGRPNVIWQDARVYVYEWTMRKGVLIWAVGGGYSGAAGVENIEQRQMLLIQFDAKDSVKRFEKVTRPAFTPYGDFLKQWLSKTHEKK